MTRGIGEPWLAARALPAELGHEWARSWPHWFGSARVGLPRAPERVDLALVETPLGRMVAKRVRVLGWKRPLVRFGARAPRGERAFRNAEVLLARGFTTPAPLAVLGRPDESVLVTRYVDGRGLWEFLLESRNDPEAEKSLIAVLAAGLARLHGVGLRHRDLKASNLLLMGASTAPELVWTDLDGLFAVGTVEPRVRARDLARLGTSFESAEARTAGVRAGHWPALLSAYLTCALGRAPRADEFSSLAGWTRRWSARWIKKHLAEGKAVR